MKEVKQRKMITMMPADFRRELKNIGQEFSHIYYILLTYTLESEKITLEKWMAESSYTNIDNFRVLVKKLMILPKINDIIATEKVMTKATFYIAEAETYTMLLGGNNE